MQQRDNLDQQAVLAAREYMGSFAWPTVVFALAVFASYFTVLALAVMGAMPLLAAVPIAAFLTYLSYTVVHEAAHGTISGSNQSLRWLNEALGYIAAWILMLPLTAHRHEHLAHHRHTNDAEEDPDFIGSQLRRSPLLIVSVVLRMAAQQYRYYWNNRWGRGPRSQDIALCLESAAALLPRLALFAAGFWLEGVALFGVAWLLGVALLLFLFAFIVHYPYDKVGRYVDTSTIVIDGVLGRIVTGLWVYQNYHSIHHLFPRVPFYRYTQLFADIEDVMTAKGAPVYRLGFSGLQPREAEAV